MPLPRRILLLLTALMVAMMALITAGMALAEERRLNSYIVSCGYRDSRLLVGLWALMLFLPAASKPSAKPAERPAAGRKAWRKRERP